MQRSNHRVFGCLCSAQSAGSLQSWTSTRFLVTAQTTNMALIIIGHQLRQGPRRQPRPQTSTWPQATAQTTDIHLALDGNKGYRQQGRTVVFTLALRGSTGLAITMATQISTASSGHVVHGPHHGFRWQKGPWSFKWPLVVTRAMDINTNPSCSSALDPDTPALMPILSLPSSAFRTFATVKNDCVPFTLFLSQFSYQKTNPAEPWTFVPSPRILQYLERQLLIQRDH